MLPLLLMVQAVAPAPAEPESAQILFDRASAAAGEKRYADALAILDGLQVRLTKSNKTSGLAIVQGRRGYVLSAMGDDAGARTALLAALAVPDLPRGERHDAALTLHGVEERAVDYPAARAAAQIALHTAESDAARLIALGALARDTLFDGDGKAVSYAADAVVLAEKAQPPLGKDALSSYYALKGRAQLNAGDVEGAQATFAKALSLQGGLTLKTSFQEAMTRGDAAITALLAKRTSYARQLLAYTGAGRIEQASFTNPLERSLAECGGEAGLLPTDMAIIQFGIREDGTVSYVQPIYASRAGPIAAAFAKAVRSWSWRPEELAKIPAFYRAGTRLQLRCTREMQTPSIMSLLADRTLEWLNTQNVAPLSSTVASANVNSARGLEIIRADLAARKTSQNPLDPIPVEMALLNSHLIPEEEGDRMSADIRERLRTASAPLSARAYPEIESLLSSYDDIGRKGFAEALQRYLTDPMVAADPVVSAAARLLAADRRTLSAPARRAMIEAVAKDDRLADRDPLRVGAWIRLANLQAQERDFAAAEQSFRKTGLEAEQCALVDARPVMKSSGASSADFPMEAMRWGFEGFTRIEYDITADGRTANQRVVVAYPPIVFEAASLGVVRDTRYEQRFRPEGAIGCSGNAHTINFRIDASLK
ncbi:energy transducer TonB [Sphingomonas sp. ID0503]|uniref:energy transducer TonB n=1 Tax=Sphingomonas sp. ID0503 TaxID=3399691 RepID=UPI003AFAF1FB